MTQLDRRRFVAGVLGAAAALATGCTNPGTGPLREPGTSTSSSPGVPGTSAASPPTSEVGDGGGEGSPLDPPPDPGLGRDPFTLAVASGDPLPDGVVLWTRLAPDPQAPDGSGGMPDAPVPLLWEVAVDERFDRTVAAGLVSAAPEHGHTVHVEVAGLSPGRWYAYRFRIGEWISPIGRTRTAPAAGAPAGPLRLAVGSCQRWESGYYTAYPHLVADQPDLVVWTGDYIYADGGAAPGAGPRDVAGGEATTLAEYRNRYAQYRSDPGLRSAHAACPWLVTWDDHEVEDNYAGLVPRDGSPDADGAAFAARRDAAYQAWWEHMPVRLPPPAAGGSPIYRSLSWGALARFVVLDGRQYRSDQPCGDGFVRACADRDDPTATMLGAEQEAWLARELASAAADRVGWTVLVNQVLMTELAVPLGGDDVQVNTDAWDGYPAARRRLLEAARDAGAPNLVVLTGDLHCSIVGDLRLDGATIGSEFLGPSISSPFPADLSAQLPFAPLVLSQIKLAQGTSRGYLNCTVDESRWRTDYRWVRTVARPESDLDEDGPGYVVDAGTPGARRV